jgi:two-component system cell cycle sensor histidine kinase/response regulator CckA
MALITESKTILVVDDEPVVLKHCSEILKRGGYIVLPASHGEEALRLYREKKGTIDLALVDIVMPVMSGIELIGRLKKLNPQMKIVLVSGYSPIEMKTLLGPEGSHLRMMWKPFERKALLSMIRHLLDEPTAATGF